jgi:hypothetical protein
MSSLRTVLVATFAALVVAAPASAAAPLPDAVMSSNVEYLGSIQQDVGLTTGAKVVGEPDVRHLRQEHLDLRHTGQAAKFVHSARWPREGADRFALIGGEENFTGRSELNNSEFSVYSAEKVLAGQSKSFEGPVAQVPPAGNGVYADGKPVAGALGCSVHWFQEHRTFRDGGLVALSEDEDGVRFLQIGADGSIKEQGYFLSLGSSSSSPMWAGKDDVLYSIDYQRGIDILR